MQSSTGPYMTVLRCRENAPPRPCLSFPCLRLRLQPRQLWLSPITRTAKTRDEQVERPLHPNIRSYITRTRDGRCQSPIWCVCLPCSALPWSSESERAAYHIASSKADKLSTAYTDFLIKLLLIGDSGECCAVCLHHEIPRNVMPCHVTLDG